MPNIPLKWRRWIYGVAVPALPLLVAYGVIDESQASLWIAVLGAIFVPALALRNTKDQ